jgi:hypothetical protein
MQYFDTLPKIIYTDENGTSSIRTNLLARVNILPSILKDPVLYYQYDIQESDTPEIIAHKYYGDSYRYWIVLFANQLLDPQWDWPMTGQVFNDYVNKKYPNENVYTTIHHYEKVITQTNMDTITTSNIEIDEAIYNSLVPSSHTYTLPTGTVTVNIDKKTVSVYEYESGLNESKRTINILNSKYVDQLESQFKKLLNA